MNVVLRCLLALAAIGWSVAPATAQSEGTAAPGGRTGMILAVSWQPAFCETRPDKPECESQTDERVDATRFSLHGLWVVRRSYCGIDEPLKAVDKSGDWQALPEVTLPGEVKDAVAQAMPGTQSALERHEWIKHGTCSGLTAAEYYSLSVGLLDELNSSGVGRLFAGNVGNSIDEHAIRQAFEESFGPGAGDRVKMQCRRDGERRIITELTIGLAGAPSEAYRQKGSLGELIRQAGATKFGCPEGIVDAAGLQ